MEFLKNQAVSHYEKMICFAEKQPEAETPVAEKMEDSIFESWFGNFCSYCFKYGGCRFGCKLFDVEAGFKDDHNCCSGLWLRMNQSPTWGEWISWAKEVLEYIKKHG